MTELCRILPFADLHEAAGKTWPWNRIRRSLALHSKAIECPPVLFFPFIWVCSLCCLSSFGFSSRPYRPHLRPFSRLICILHNSVIPIPLFPAIRLFSFYLPSSPFLTRHLSNTSVHSFLFLFIPDLSSSSFVPSFGVSCVNLLFLISSSFI